MPRPLGQKWLPARLASPWTSWKTIRHLHILLTVRARAKGQLHLAGLASASFGQPRLNSAILLLRYAPAFLAFKPLASPHDHMRVVNTDSEDRFIIFQPPLPTVGSSQLLQGGLATSKGNPGPAPNAPKVVGPDLPFVAWLLI